MAMKFFNRTDELALLRQNSDLAENVGAQMTVVLGKRRTGKTRLIQEAFTDRTRIDWFIEKDSEELLTRSLGKDVADALGIPNPNFKRFADLFETVMLWGKSRPITLVIDECQWLKDVNPAIFSQMQKIWDRHKYDSHVHLVMCGSSFSMMKTIFQDAREPLFGRQTGTVFVKPFSTNVLKTVLGTFNPDYTNEDLLALFTLTGGIPRYVEALMEAGATTKDAMLRRISDHGAFFMLEGKMLLTMEFGKESQRYLRIMECIACGKNKLAEIESEMCDVRLSGYLSRLENDYEHIERLRPIFAKPRSQSVRYAVKNIFIRYWLRFFQHNKKLTEQGHWDLLTQDIISNYETFSGYALEEWFRRKLWESKRYRDVGAWWQRKNGADQNEIDIVALTNDGKKVFVAEVKRKRKSFDKKKFLDKVEALKTAELGRIELETDPCCLTMEDM